MKIKTTTDLKAIRTLLFNTTHEAAAFLGLRDSDSLLTAERGRRWSIQGSHATALEKIYKNVEDYISAYIEAFEEGSPFLIVYQNDDVYREFEPYWSERLPTANMHFRAAALAHFAMGDDAPILVTLNPTSYEEFRGNRPDSPELRQRWAAHYAAQYKRHDD